MHKHLYHKRFFEAKYQKRKRKMSAHEDPFIRKWHSLLALTGSDDEEDILGYWLSNYGTNIHENGRIAELLIKDIDYAFLILPQAFIPRPDGSESEYRLDFLFQSYEGKRACIELDGPIHKRRVTQDAERDRLLQSMQIPTIRCDNASARIQPNALLHRAVEIIRC